MGKQGTGDRRREVVAELPALLSTFTGALENSGVLSIFGLTAERGTVPSAQVSSERSNAATDDAIGDHVVGDDATELKATADSNLLDGPSDHPMIGRVASDTGSEEDMPGLERLERSSVTASLEKVSNKARKFKRKQKDWACPVTACRQVLDLRVYLNSRVLFGSCAPGLRSCSP